MIVYNYTNENIVEQTKENLDELKEIRKSYSNRIELCIKCMENINELRTKTENVKVNTLYDKSQMSLSTFLKQISIIDMAINTLETIQNNTTEESVSQYNQMYSQIKKEYINNSIYNESIMIDFIRFQNQLLEAENPSSEVVSSIPISENVETNGTLLISEVKGKVYLPYTREEVVELLRENPDKYQSAADVVEKVFIKDFSTYKHQAISRFWEAYDLVTKREKYQKVDGINLGLEMLRKKFLHPAIIAACRTLDELDVYLDCLEKNELDDFKIFDIEYELTPAIVKKQDSLWKEFFFSFIPKKEKN